jgi:hypothetical protein
MPILALPRLHREQADQHRHGQRHDKGLELGCGDSEPLDRTEHRDRRRNHAVTVEQGSPGEPDHDQPVAPALINGGRRETEEGDDAALPIIVGPHHEAHIFYAHHDEQRPNTSDSKPSTASVSNRPAEVRHSRKV